MANRRLRVSSFIVRDDRGSMRVGKPIAHLLAIEAPHAPDLEAGNLAAFEEPVNGNPMNLEFISDFVYRFDRRPWRDIRHLFLPAHSTSLAPTLVRSTRDSNRRIFPASLTASRNAPPRPAIPRRRICRSDIPSR